MVASDDDTRPQLGLFSAVSYLIGNVIGSGIFVSPTVILEGTGSVGACLLAWLFCGLVALLGAICYVELGTSIPRAGSDYAYLTHVGWFAGGVNLSPLAFGITMLYLLISWPASLAVLAAAFAKYMTTTIEPWVCLDERTTDQVQLLLAITFLMATAALNFGRIDKAAAHLENVINVLKFVTFGIIIAFGAYHLLFADGLDNFSHPFVGTESDVGKIMLATYAGFWSYQGWDALNLGLGDIKNYRRNLPLGIAIGLALITVTYLLVNVAYLSVLGTDGMLESIAVAQSFTRETLGRDISLVVPFVVGLMMMGAINSTFFTGSRLMEAVAADGQISRIFSLTHTTSFSPQTAVTALTSMAVVLLATGTMETMLNVVVFSTMLARAASMCAIIYIRLWKTVKVPIVLHLTFLVVAMCLALVPTYEEPVFTCIGLAIVGVSATGHWACTKWATMPTNVKTAHEYLLTRTQIIFNSRFISSERVVKSRESSTRDKIRPNDVEMTTAHKHDRF